ncbi:MAG: hypothetical protein ACREQ5_18215 [Candidatus Dormibacteria bacterium]
MPSAPVFGSAALHLSGRSASAQQPSEIGGFAGEDHVVVMGEERDVGVDDIVRACFSTQPTDLPGDLAVQSLLPDPAQQAGNQRLGRTASPDLRNAAGGGNDGLAPPPGRFDQRCHLPIAALEPDQGTRVENETHSGDTPAATLRGAFQDLISVTQLGLGKRPELLLPCRYRIRQGFEPQSIAGGLRQPG